MEGFAGADAHGSTWAPARFPVGAVADDASSASPSSSGWSSNGDTPFFVHASFIRPHPPRRNPIGYHDLYSAEAVGPFVGLRHRRGGGGDPSARRVRHGDARRRRARATSGSAGRCGRPTTGHSAKWTTGWLRSSTTSTQSGLAESTLVVLTSDHGEMGGDHWLLEKLGFWDESYHVPLIVVDPRAEADGGRGTDRRCGDRIGRRAADDL